MRTSKEALATYLGMEWGDLSDHAYKPGHFTRAVYAVDDAYYCAKKFNAPLPRATRKGGMEIQWKEVPDTYANSRGWYIFTNEKV